MTKPLEHIRTIEDISIPNDIARLNELGVLEVLLKDNSTGGNIVWGTTAYEELGQGYSATDEMSLESITGDHGELIRRRARKNEDEKSSLTRTHAEVFTPTWICKKMIDHADKAWLENHDDDVSWKEAVRFPRLEITCGEAPYLFGRYDAADGNPIPVDERTGIFDRKLRIILENTSRRQDFMRWMIVALCSVYGYEFQGDNLLITRILDAGLDYVDKRANDGALWAIGGSGLADFMSELEAEGAVFEYKPDSAKAIKGQPGWWIKGYPKKK